jgi:hypothetical protein
MPNSGFVRLAPSGGVAGVARDGKEQKNGSNGAGWMKDR